MVIPHPQTLLKTDRYDSGWRHGQEEAVSHIVNFVDENCNTLKGVTPKLPLALPTGAGKSLVYMAAIRVLQNMKRVKRVVILTSTKALQKQLIEEFENSVMEPVVIKGKSNYKCDILPNLTAANAPCTAGFDCHMKSECAYFSTLNRARKAELVITNYPYYLNMQQQERDLGEFDLMICDEAHHTPDSVLDHVTVEVRADELDGFGGIPSTFKKFIKMDAVRRWAGSVHIAMSDELARLKRLMQNNPSQKTATKYQKMADLERRLAMIRATEYSYCAVRENNTVRVARVSCPENWAEPYIFSKVKCCVMVSATISMGTLAVLGDRITDVVSVDSLLPKERRPTVTYPALYMHHKLTTIEIVDKWVQGIDDIIRERLDRKGIIHTQSFRRTEILMEHSQYKELFYVTKSGRTDSVVEAFKAASEPAILIGPNLTTGYDFPDDQCRWQIIGKCPYPSLGDEILVQRKKRIFQYYENIVAQTLAQMCGRGMRGPDDWCEVIMVDTACHRFITKHPRLFPGWFLHGYKGMASVLPMPMSIPNNSKGVQ